MRSLLALIHSTVKGSQLDTHKKVVGYQLNCLDEPVFRAVSKPLLTEFGIHHRLESVVICIENLVKSDSCQKGST